MASILRSVRKWWGFTPVGVDEGGASPDFVKQADDSDYSVSDEEDFADAARSLDFTPAAAGSRPVLVPTPVSVVPLVAAPPPQQVTRKRKEREPARFNGKSDFTDYKAQFETVAYLNQWSREEMGLQLAISLTDEAREVLSSLRGADMHNYDRLVEALECRYSPRGRESQYYLELMSRDQGPEEDVTSYGHTLRRLASKAFSDRPVDEMMLVNTFIRGLRSVEMKRHVYHEKCGNLYDAIHAAVTYEAFDRPLRESARKPRLTIAPVQGRGQVKQVQHGGSDRPDPDDGSGAVAMTDVMVRQLVKEAVASELKQNRPPRRDYSNIECYSCREKGHISRNCPRKASSSAPATQGPTYQGPNF